MNSKELKQVIKQMVQESLIEVFAEMNLQLVVENAIKSQLCESKKQKTNSMSLRSSVVEASRPEPVIESTTKNNVMEKIGAIDSDVWRSIYGDTAKSSNPILKETKEDKGSNPELVPEALLENRGLMKDYSKLAGLTEDSESVIAENDEWNKIREARQKMLQATMKR